MTKAATIASLVRIAAKTETEFVQTIQQVLEEGDADRAAEFFDRLNIPRSIDLHAWLGISEDAAKKADAITSTPVAKIVSEATTVVSYEHEREVSAGIQKFLDRHERKIKWHAAHPPSDAGEIETAVGNVLLLFRCAVTVTELRLERLQVLLRLKDELNPAEWAIARELMRGAYLSFRNYLNVLVGEWAEAMQKEVSREKLGEELGNFYEIVDQTIRSLEATHLRVEERRQGLTVLPGDPFPPVKPPNYFGGDLLGRGPWKQFWSGVVNRAHQFRETAA